MKFGKWLYNLTNTDQYILVGYFIVGLGLSYLTITALRFWHQKIHGSNKYSHAVRTTPFALLGIAFFFATILFKKVNLKISNEDSLSFDPKFDIVNPSFTINNEEEKISVTANKGNFITENEILLNENVVFKSEKFKIISDSVVFDKVKHNAYSSIKSKFISENTSIVSNGFNITDRGNKINFKGKTILIIK